MSGGFGSSPFGTGPYGYGMPSSGSPATGQMFADAQTGTIGSGRKIDPGTRQYVFDDNGNPVGVDTVPQLVQLAYSTVKGTSILPTLGESYSELETIDDDFQERMNALAIAPVQFLVDDKRLEILSVTIDRIGTSGARIAVNWKDLTSGREGQTTL